MISRRFVDRLAWFWHVPLRSSLLIVVLLTLASAGSLCAQTEGEPAKRREWSVAGSFFEMFQGGDFIGAGIVIVILLLSLLMVALIVDDLLTIRRSVLLPPGFVEQVQKLLGQGHLGPAEQYCKSRPSCLSEIMKAGLADIRFGHASAVKAMEDAAQEQNARLMRKVEYLAVVGNVAPMLGLLGTVWGLLMAFGEATEQVAMRAETLSHDISIALWTTVLGLMVAIPALSVFAILRSRVDELLAECALQAEHVLAPFKRMKSGSRASSAAAGRERSASSEE